MEGSASQELATTPESTVAIVLDKLSQRWSRTLRLSRIF